MSLSVSIEMIEINLLFALPGLYLKLRERCNFGTKNSRSAWREIKSAMCILLKSLISAICLFTRSLYYTSRVMKLRREINTFRTPGNVRKIAVIASNVIAVNNNCNKWLWTPWSVNSFTLANLGRFFTGELLRSLLLATEFYRSYSSRIIKELFWGRETVVLNGVNSCISPSCRKYSN